MSDSLKLTRGPAWFGDALCREYPQVNFFPGQGESPYPALKVCSRCLVKQECLEYMEGLDASMPGIWGGMSERQRRLRRAGCPTSEARLAAIPERPDWAKYREPALGTDMATG